MASAERRRIRRHETGNIPFCFRHEQIEPLEAVAEDFSIRSARFPLTLFEQLRPFVSGYGELTFGQLKTRFEDLKIPAGLVREENGGTFVVAYKTTQLEIGSTVRGSRASYKILKFLGGGQAAEAYKAEVADTTVGTPGLQPGDLVVVKIPLFFPYMSDAEINDVTSRLEILLNREEVNLKRVAELSCVAGFLDIGHYRFPREDTSTTKFIVQRFVDGKPLVQYMDTEYPTGAARTFVGLPPKEFYKFGRLLAVAVRQVHSCLVIHGDLWPENIMVSDSMNPVLIDFGQAAFREAAEPVIRVSGRNQLYLAPEDARSVVSDVYSLGGVLFYLGTGEDPPAPVKDIRTVSAMILDRIRAKNRELFQEARGVADIISHCVCFADRRYKDVRTVIERLDTFFRQPDETEGISVAVSLGKVAEEGQVLATKGSELFRRMAAVRGTWLQEDLREMSQGVFDVAGDAEAIAAGLTQFLAFLGKGDEYLTISTPRFWRPGNPGMNGEFLSMNVMAAQRGATIRRLLVVAPSEQNAHLDQIMASQVQALREVKEIAPKAKYEVKVLFISNERHEEMLKTYRHFGVLVKKTDVAAMFPEYREDGLMVAVRFRAGLNRVGDLRAVFSTYWRDNDALTLRYWPSESEIFARAYEIYESRGCQHGKAMDDYLAARRELIERTLT
jgi:serine/threonine protein kinase